MKNRSFYYLAVFACALAGMMGITSCKKTLDQNPISGTLPDVVFGNVVTTQQALLGVYQELAGDFGYGKVVSMYFMTATDELMGSAADDQDRKGLAQYDLTSSNTQLEAPLEQMYSGIERANLCIYYIPRSALYTNGPASQKVQMQRMYGEALTLRAQFYLEMIRNWGDMPAQWLPSALQTNFYIPRTDRDSIYDHLLDDLQLAESLVPWRGDAAITSIDERLTKGAVKGLRARIALFRAGYSLRSTGEIVKGTNANKYYQIADTECVAIMNSGKHMLNPSFKSVFKDYIAAHKVDNTYGELMFEVGAAGGGASADSKLGYYNGPKFAAQGNATFLVLPSYFYLFDSTDTRRDVTIAPYDCNADFTKVGQKSTAIRDGKFRRDWITPLPATTLQYFGLDWPILRYSDVLLMLAEADNELNNGPSSTAIGAFQQVRARGYGGNASLIGNPPTDHDGFLNAIVKERALEFGGENVRRFDLVRWNLLWQKIHDSRATLALMGNAGAPYNNYPTKMFYKTGSTADDATLWANSFYAKSPSTPAGTTSVNWLGGGLTGNIIATFLTPSGTYLGFAGYYDSTKFHTNLLPIPQHFMDANYMLAGHQNPGYQ